MKINGRYKKLLLLAVLLGMLFCVGSVKASAATNTATNAVKQAVQVTGGEWVKKSAGLKYRYADGSYAKNVWLKIDGGIYHINAKGVCETGWFTWEDNRYLANKSGKLYVSKWHTNKYGTYYLRASGAMGKSQWLKISGKYYYFNAKGRLVTGKIFSVNGKYYCVDKKGVRVKSSWITKNGKTYYFDASGVRVQDTWKKIKGSYYYFDKKGILLTSQWVGDYYVGKDGARLTDCEVDGYKLDSTGKKIEFTGKYIFVGDSRTVGMSNAVSKSNTVYIGEVSMGLVWLKSVASVKLASCLDADSNAKVILGFGINDLSLISSYISYYKTLLKKYPDTEFYILSVNPVDEAVAKKKGFTVTNSQIRTFNKSMKAAFPDNYLDTYTYLQKAGFGTPDGIHYNASTYVKLYDYIISEIG
ncbi:MAG: hypothetical protein LUI07_10505 [Lachnospiraceae bacterium]|nr:hypothetical protein [Lachnospiraceae bacterium]